MANRYRVETNIFTPSWYVYDMDTRWLSRDFETRVEAREYARKKNRKSNGK